MKSLDEKLANIHADPHGAKDFILADAKDADMAAGLAAPGEDPVTGKLAIAGRLPRPDARDRPPGARRHHAHVARAPATSLTIQERLFDDSPVTPAVRANDTTDIHLIAGGTYAQAPSRPFRTATIEQIQSGKPTRRRASAGAAPTSGSTRSRRTTTSTFDYATLEAYKEFRLEAERKGFRHFLEVFDPNACGAQCPHGPRPLHQRPDRPHARRRAAQRAGRSSSRSRTTGREAMEELVAYDPHLVPGILGGSSGTTLRRVQAARGGEEARRARGALRPQDQQQRAPAHVRHATCTRSRTARSMRRKRAAPITATWRSWGSRRTAPCPRTCS